MGSVSTTRSNIITATPTAAASLTGLDFIGNVNYPSASPATGLLWRSGVSAVAPPARQPMTYFQRVFPRDQMNAARTLQTGGYYSGLFYAQWQTSWNPGNLRYYGMHPYPDNGETAPYYWEVSWSAADQYDTNPGSPAYGLLEFERWFDQVMIINGLNYKYYWDWPNLDRLIEVTEDHTTEPSDPAIAVGFAPWAQEHECYSGVIRRQHFYTAAMTLQEVADHLATPGTFYDPWYINLDPTPDDISDKSGSNRHPAWLNANRPLLWTA